MMRKTAALSFTGLIALTSCGGDGDETVRLAIAGEVPYSYLNESGEPEGVLIDLAELLFVERMGYDIEVELTDWDNLIPGLNAGQFDAISAGMSILPERCDQAAFAEPELMYATALLVEEGNPKEVYTLEDVAHVQETGEDLRVATLSAGIEAGFSDDLGIDYQGVGSAEDGVDMITGGRTDVFALTANSLNAMSAGIDGVEVTDAFVQEVSAGATVFREEGSPNFETIDAELLDEYNEHLADLKQEEGELLALISDYGFTETEIPPAELSAAELCDGDVEALNEKYLN